MGLLIGIFCWLFLSYIVQILGLILYRPVFFFFCHNQDHTQSNCADGKSTRIHDKPYKYILFCINRAFEDEKKARMGVVECVKHGLLEPFNVLWEKEGQFDYII